MPSRPSDPISRSISRGTKPCSSQASATGSTLSAMKRRMRPAEHVVLLAEVGKALVGDRLGHGRHLLAVRHDSGTAAMRARALILARLLSCQRARAVRPRRQDLAWPEVRRVRGCLIGNPGPGPSRPGRPRQAFLGTPSGSLRPLQVPRLPCGARVTAIYVLLQICGRCLPLQARVAMCLIGGRRTPRHCWRATATVAVRPPGSRAIRSPSRRRPLPRENGEWAHPRPVAGSDAGRVPRRRGSGDKLCRNSPRAW